MILSETKRLLRTFRIVPNRVLGQNFMVEPSLFSKLTEYAALGQSDVVLDAGAGFGFLTGFLADKCEAVVAVEKDLRVAAVLREQVKNCTNVTVVEGDVLKAELPAFNKLVSIPPYYLSSHLIPWLLERKTECAVLILQREFADKLVAPVGSEDYGWLPVVVFHEAQVELLDIVDKSMFYPQPKVDSVVVLLVPWKTAPFEVKDKVFFKNMVRSVFTQRNRKLSNALVPFLKSTRKIAKEEAKKLADALPFAEKRVRELAPKDFGELETALTD
jgi:16S rRNA (adenine1518-N6/adenine1519-N6)-dimethyltransferase